MNQNYEPVMLPPGVKYTALPPSDLNDFVKRIKRMNTIFNLEVNDVPTSPPVERVQKFHKVVCDEIDEILEVIDSETQEEALVKLADVLADIVVYVFSEGCRWGIPMLTVLHAVMDSQDSKLVDGKPLMAEDGSKFIKGPNYQPPEEMIARILKAQKILNTPPEGFIVEPPDDEFPPYTPKLGDICYDLNRKRFYRVRAYTDPHTLEPNLFLLNRVYSDKVYDIDAQVLVHVDPDTWNKSLEGTGLPPLPQDF